MEPVGRNLFRTDTPSVILTLEGALMRVPLPSYMRRGSPQYRRPGGGFVTETVAMLMRGDFVTEVTRTYRELELEEQENRRVAYGEPEDYCAPV